MPQLTLRREDGKQRTLPFPGWIHGSPRAGPRQQSKDHRNWLETQILWVPQTHRIRDLYVRTKTRAVLSIFIHMHRIPWDLVKKTL